MGKTYKDSGVDITAADNLIGRLKPLMRTTFNDKVLSDIGLFGGFYEAQFDNISEPVLIASVDGVGTKLKIAFLMNKHDTIGQCLVNHCVNDILCCGAKPLFFLDYFATGKLDVEIAESVIRGFIKACKENDCALIGGETAEMPSFYNDNEYDISGTIVGVVEKEKIIDGSDIKAGDILIGLKSNGLHTNGYSFARKVLLEKFRIDEYVPDLSTTLGEALLAIHISYLRAVYPLIKKNLLTGIAHITGGGIIGNTKRLLRNKLQLKIDWNAWEWLPIFKFIQSVGGIDDEEMRNVFNLGIGIVLITRPINVNNILAICKEYSPVIIGEITEQE